MVSPLREKCNTTEKKRKVRGRDSYRFIRWRDLSMTAVCAKEEEYTLAHAHMHARLSRAGAELVRNSPGTRYTL